MDWKRRKENLKQAYATPVSLTITLIATFLLLIIQYFFTDYATLAGNLGPTMATLEVISQVILAVFFGINVALLWYKLRLASLTTKEGGTTVLGSILGLLVTGCPACSITIASYLGLASILSTLPFLGMEVKVLGILLLIYSTDSLLKNLTTCTRK